MIACTLPRHSLRLLSALGLLALVPALANAQNHPRPVLLNGETNAVPKPGPDALGTQSLNQGLTPTDLVQNLVGVGVTISNVSYTGANDAGGNFTGGAGIIGFDSGVVLGSGNIADIPGPNTSDSTSTGWGLPGDPDLNILIPGFSTFDATVLEFDFECAATQAISFEFVFTSEEYNEYVNTSFNDVFGFFLNGQNIALIPNTVTPVAIDNVNCNNPYNPPTGSNCAFFLNNDCSDIAPGSFPCAGNVDTEMDGLTLVFFASSPINPGPNHIKLAIADAGDTVFDSNVFIKSASLSCQTFPDPTTYCTAKKNSLGCTPTITSTGSPSATQTSGFTVSCSQVRNNKPGMLIHSTTGRDNRPFQRGLLCVKAPILRTPTTNSGGTAPPADDCSGIFAIDMNAFSHGLLGGNPNPALTNPGQTVNCQWWGRDKGGFYNTTLSDGLEYTVFP